MAKETFRILFKGRPKAKLRMVLIKRLVCDIAAFIPHPVNCIKFHFIYSQVRQTATLLIHLSILDYIRFRFYTVTLKLTFLKIMKSYC